MVQNVEKIRAMDWDSADCVPSFAFSLLDMLQSLYELEPDGSLLVRDTASTPMDPKILEAFQTVSLSTDLFQIEGEVGQAEYAQQGRFLALDNPDWQPELQEQLLYIIPLNAPHLKFLSDQLSPQKDRHNNLAFYAYWLSYAKGGETLVDVVHAYDGHSEQLHISHCLKPDKRNDFIQKIQS